MVVVRVVGDRDALQKRNSVAWAVADGAPISQSIDILLRQLRHTMTSAQFMRRFYFVRGVQPIDMHKTPSAQGLFPGVEIAVRKAGGGGTDASGGKESLAGTGLAEEGEEQQLLRMARDTTVDFSLPDLLFEQTRQQAMLAEVGKEIREKFKSDLARRWGSEAQPSVAQMDESLSKLLVRRGLAHVRDALCHVGVTTLEDLCSSTSAAICSCIGDQRSAYSLISDAHAEMVALGVDINWRYRFGRLYNCYNPRKVNEIEQLLEQYEGEEEELWFALREKYEPHVAPSTGTSAGTPLSPEGGVQRDVGAPDTSRWGEAVKCTVCGNVSVLDHRDASNTRLLRDRLEAGELNSKTLLDEREAKIEHLERRLALAESDAERHAALARQQEGWIRLLQLKIKKLERDGHHLIHPADEVLQPGDTMLEVAETSPARQPRRGQSPVMSDGGPAARPIPQKSTATKGEREELKRVVTNYLLQHAPQHLTAASSIVAGSVGKEYEVTTVLNNAVAEERHGMDVKHYLPYLLRLGANR